MFSKVQSDATFAWRVMRKSVMASATIVLCLGFSIGSTATVIAWMEGMIFRPVHGVPEVDRLFSIKTTSATGMANTSYPAYQDLRDDARAGSPLFRGLAAFGVRRFNLRVMAAAVDQDAEPIWGILATANYFDVLRVRPVIGRGFLPGEDAVAEGAPVAVISHALWQRRFGADPAVAGRRLWVNGRELTIVGVAPRDFTGTFSGLRFDLWTPVTMHPAFSSSAPILQDRGVRWLSVFGRLGPDGSLESARAEAQTIGNRLAAMYHEDRDRGLTARTLDVGPSERLAPLLVLMFGITVLVLLIVCTNIANLLLLRGAGRQHELAVRLALGARPARIVRQLMTESLILATTGVVLGLALAFWGQGSMDALIPDSPLPVGPTSGMDLRVVLVVALIGIVTLVGFGLAPAIRAVRAAGRVSLTGGTRGSTAGGSRLRGALVGAQFALSLAVLVTAGIFLDRLDELQHVDRGFREGPHVLVGTLDFEIAGIRGEPLRARIVDRIVERLTAVPGVRAASAASFVPLGFLGYAWMDTRIDGYVPKPGEAMTFLSNRVTAGYFDTMGIPIVRGRPIEAIHREGGQDVAVVNATFARRFWTGHDPVGRTIRVANRELMVVGVAADGKYEFTAPLDDPSPPFIYLPYAQWGGSTPILHVLTTGDPLAVVPEVRREVAAVELYMAHGVTTIRGVQLAAQPFALKEKERSAANAIVAPRIYNYQRPGAGWSEGAVDTPEKARAWVRWCAANGVDGMKLVAYPPRIMAALLDEAKKAGLGSTAHLEQRGVAQMDALTAAKLGLGTVTHFYGHFEPLLRDYEVQPWPDNMNYNDEQLRFGQVARLWNQIHPPGSPEWNAYLQEHLKLGTIFDPTMTAYAAGRDVMRMRNADWHERYTLPSLMDFYTPNRENHGSYFFDWTLADEIAWRNFYQVWFRLLNDYKKIGGRVTVSDDAAYIYNTWGFGYIHEMTLLQEAGFHPLEVIRAATMHGAEALHEPKGLELEFGIVRPGMLADLVVVDQNPLQNLFVLYGTGHLRLNDTTGRNERVGGIRYTIKDGIVYDAKKLLADVAAMVEAQKKQRATSSR